VTTTIWDLQNKIIQRLLIWSATSAIAGIFLIFSSAPFWHAFGIQAVAWGLVDAAIAVFGWLNIRRIPVEGRKSSQVKIKEAQKLSRILWINAGLDFLYITAGVILVIFPGASDASWSGHGWGIIVQGGFLLFFDVLHALRVPPERPLLPFPAFTDSQHLPYFWAGNGVSSGGKPAALFVHGFPGTPAEMRPLSQALHDQGWSVQGVLLPGFGPQINSLETKRLEDWLQTIQNAVQSLRSQFSPVILVGYSMGAALVIHLVASQSEAGKINGGNLANQFSNNCRGSDGSPFVDGLVLLAPFIWEDAWWQHMVLPVLSLFIPAYVQPLKRRDLSNPQTRKVIQDLLPEVDLEIPEIRDALHQVTIPLSIFGEVMRAGQKAYHSLPQIQIPTLIVQGSQDPVVRPDRTRRLLERFPLTLDYEEVPAGHKLIDPQNPAWDQVEKIVLTYINDCCNHRTQ
jgi:carboxylesterase